MTSEYENSTPTTKAPPPTRTVERRIGRATFIVSSRFNDEGREKDIVSTLSRLIQHDNNQSA